MELPILISRADEVVYREVEVGKSMLKLRGSVVEKYEFEREEKLNVDHDREESGTL